MRGRKPLPTNIVKLRGNPGNRPVRESGLKPPVSIPECPAHLTERARAEWTRLTTELSALGIISELDRSSLAALCVATARWIEAEEQVALMGTIVKAPISGTPMQNPYLAIANAAMAQMIKLHPEFGCTPSSRERLSARAKDKESDPADRYFA